MVEQRQEPVILEATEQPKQLDDYKKFLVPIQTPEDREAFAQRLHEGFETLARITRDEVPILQRPEFSLTPDILERIY